MSTFPPDNDQVPVACTDVSCVGQHLPAHDTYLTYTIILTAAITYIYICCFIYPGGGEIFRTRPDRPCDPLSRVPFPGVKRPGRRVDHPPPSSAQVKVRAELYLYPPLGLHGVLWGELYFTLYISYTSYVCNIVHGPCHGSGR